MHHVFAKHKERVYHVYSTPDYYSAVRMGKAYAQECPQARFDCVNALPQQWLNGGKLTARDFCQAYWGSGLILELKATRS